MNREKFTKELFEAVEIVTGVTEQQIKSRTKAGAIPDARKSSSTFQEPTKTSSKKKHHGDQLGLRLAMKVADHIRARSP